MFPSIIFPLGIVKLVNEITTTIINIKKYRVFWRSSQNANKKCE